MTDPPDESGPPSLTRITVRRSFVSGRFFVAYGVGMGTLLAAALAESGGTAFTSAFPLLLPIFGAVGSMGGLTVFSNDRMKGTLEYLMAYGVGPRRIFADTLAATVVLTTVVVAIPLGVGLGVSTVKGHPVSWTLVGWLVLYGVPMSYVSSAFAGTLGMFWTSLSSPSTAMNSPLGIVPLLGVLPPVGTLLGTVALGAAGWFTPTAFFVLALSIVVAVGVTVVLLLSMTGRLLRRERLLSPA